MTSEYSQLPSSGPAATSRHAASSRPPLGSTDFLLQPVNLSAQPIGEDMDGWDKTVLGPIPLLVTPCVREIIDIDTVNQRATVRIDIVSDWIDDGALELDESGQEGYKRSSSAATCGYRLKEVPHFKPQLRVNNLVEALTEPQEDFWVSCVQVDGRQRVCVSCYFTQLAVVFCPMNLLNFPFDAQVIPIELVSDSFPADCIEFRVRMQHDRVKDLEGGVFLDQEVAERTFPAFNFDGIALTYHIREYAHLAHYSYSSAYGVLSLKIHCSRDPYYYLYRIVVMQLMVSVLKMATSLVPLEDYNTKMGWDGSLFLTLVAFSFVIAQEVPKVAYTTRIDKLVIAASVLMIVDILAELVLAFLANSVMPTQTELLDSLDSWRALTYMALLLAVTLWFFLPLNSKRVLKNQ